MGLLLRARWLTIPRAAVLLFLILLTIILNSRPANANPAFARKYGMPCSGCHVAWPLLNRSSRTTVIK